jgi:hypothetical protein
VVSGFVFAHKLRPDIFNGGNRAWPVLLAVLLIPMDQVCEACRKGDCQGEVAGDDKELLAGGSASWTDSRDGFSLGHGVVTHDLKRTSGAKALIAA